MPNKKNIFLVIYLLCVFSASSQNATKYNRYFDKDQLSFSFNSTQLIQNESNVKLSPFSRGINLQMMYPFVGSKSNIAMAIGFGLACQNYYLDQFINYNNDSLWFSVIPDSLNLKKYKLNTNYITVPIELRFRTNPNSNNKSFKIYAGFRVGMLINNHTKYVGYDPNTDDKIKKKKYNIKHIQQFDYGFTLRVGSGKIMLNGYYSLSKLFDDNKCCELIPYEIGLTLVLF